MGKKEMDPQEALRQVRLLLADWLERGKEARGPVARILRLLDTIEEHLAQPAGRAAGRGGTVIYSVEKTAAGEVLTEGGKDRKSPPFRVPRPLYDAVVEVLASADEPLKFEQVLQQVSAKADIAPGDYQVRTCLRFWLSRNPPLLERSRSTYQPLARAAFRAEASHAWRSAASKA